MSTRPVCSAGGAGASLPYARRIKPSLSVTHTLAPSQRRQQVNQSGSSETVHDKKPSTHPGGYTELTSSANPPNNSRQYAKASSSS